MALFDTLSAVDAQFIYWDSDRTPMNMGNLCIFDGEQLRDEAGAFRLDDVRAAIESRLHLVPRYRRKLLPVPGEIAHPVLVDDPDFDINQHVKLIGLPRPGTVEQLKQAYAQLHEGMLSHGRPLWQITFIDGLEDGRVGMVQKIHHAPFDGASTVDVMDLLFDSTPEHLPTPTFAWHPEPAPDPLMLMGAKWGEQMSHMFQAMGRPTSEPSDPERLSEVSEALKSLESIKEPPATSLNRPVGPHRRYDWVHTTLSDAKQIRALVPGSTVNDVMITIIGGGLRRLLASRGEAVDDLVLQIMIPVSLRTGNGLGDGTGNMVSGFIAPLPICEADGVKRLARIHQSTKALKESKQAVGIQLMSQSAEYAPASLMAAAGRRAMQQASVINFTVTNVPGPRHDLFLLGARMVELNPMVLIGNNITLNFAIESYVNMLSIGLCADADANPDLPVLRDGIREDLDGLLTVARD